ncbi:MAG: tRNA (guanosine(37)-N1)-methyltransferase TrmD [Armatimonadetes bacterium]|nr:tRNA (guanosine(37)-N1)-methyltransferase TrmD [Armatimonadota bacterium]MDW8121450.1 tRNA (guanosine(37)-N1)-methyltransferase TrmD [Armatimonadota bacterium]
MTFHIVTLFPEWFESPLKVSIIGRALKAGLVEVQTYQLRDFARDKHRTVDDYPFGGGPGLVMKAEPFFLAVEFILEKIGADQDQRVPILLLSPRGRPFRQEMAQSFAQFRHLILLCGHYEGVDERVGQYLATEEVSIGDFILTGGEPAAMVIVDAVSRILPSVIDSASPTEESFSGPLLEYPQYTRPRDFRGWKVPEVLLTGNHQEIARWRRRESLAITLRRRPDLLLRAHLSPEDLRTLAEIEAEETRSGRLLKEWSRLGLLHPLDREPSPTP